MKRKGKLGHNDGAQSPSNPMPKHPYLFIEKGRCWTFRMRIPSDLVRAGCYKGKDIKRSLKTRDYAMANRLASTLKVEVELDFDAKRRQIGLASPFAIAANSGDSPAKRELSDLTDIERSDLILRFFITTLKQQADANDQIEESDTSEIDDDDRLETARIDVAAIAGSRTHQKIDWQKKARQVLEKEGLSIEGADNSLLRSFAAKIKMATLELARKTERAW